MGRHQLNTTVQSQFLANQVFEPSHELGERGRLRFTNLDQEDRRVTSICPRGGESQSITGSDLRLPFGNVLQILRPDIAPVDDDHILGTAGDV